MKYIIRTICNTSPIIHIPNAKDDANGLRYVDKSIIPIERVVKTLATTGLSRLSETSFGNIMILINTKTKIIADNIPKTFRYFSP